MTTARQKLAIRYCCEMLNITFEGDINDFTTVSRFLSIYLNEAKELDRELQCEYSAYQWSKY